MDNKLITNPNQNTQNKDKDKVQQSKPKESLWEKIKKDYKNYGYTYGMIWLGLLPATCWTVMFSINHIVCSANKEQTPEEKPTPPEEQKPPQQPEGEKPEEKPSPASFYKIPKFFNKLKLINNKDQKVDRVVVKIFDDKISEFLFYHYGKEKKLVPQKVVSTIKIK